MPQNVIVDNYTKVSELSKAIDIWQKIEKTSSSSEEKRIARENIQKQTQAKANLVNIIESKLGKLSEENKYKISAYIGDTGKNRYDKLSINLLNDYLDTKDQVDYMEQENPSDSLGMKILEGKTGVDYMTVVKSTLAVSAVSLLAQAGTFSALSSGLSALMAFNPVVGACAVVLGTASLIRMARKIFAPEIKKLASNVRVQEKFNQLSAESDEKYELPDFDAYRKGYTEGTPDKEAPFTKPGEKYDAAKFESYRERIIEEAYEATKTGKKYTPKYENIISKDEVDKCVAKGIEKALIEKAEEERAVAEKEAREKAEAEKEAREKAEAEEEARKKAEAEKTPKKPEIVTAEMVVAAKEESDKAINKQTNAQTEYDAAKREFDKVEKEYKANMSNMDLLKKHSKASEKLEKCENALIIASKNAKDAHAKFIELQAAYNKLRVRNQPTSPAPIKTETPVATPETPATGENAEQQEEIPLLDEPERKLLTPPTDKKKTTADIYNEVEGGIDRTKKANGQGKNQEAYDNFMDTYRKILRTLADGRTRIQSNKKGAGPAVTTIIKKAKDNSLDAVKDESVKAQYQELFVSLEALVRDTKNEIEKGQDSKEIVKKHLEEAGFTKEQIEEQLRSPEQQ